ncbi:MAG: hypothetical protein ACREVE_10085 [Gammaproteobacteria bacterium]
MKTVYCVSYDLKKPDGDYSALFTELKASSGWWQCLHSTWLIATLESADQLCDRLRRHMHADDHLLAIEVETDYSGWLPEKAWQWIKSHVSLVPV